MLTTLTHEARRRLPDASVRYFVKSLAGLGAGLALLTLWVEWLGIPPQLAIFINFVVIGFAGCLVLDRWVFRDTEPATTLRGFGSRFMGMQASMLSAKAVNYVLFVFLIEAGLYYQAAWAAGSGVSFLLSFALNRSWFRRVG